MINSQMSTTACAACSKTEARNSCAGCKGSPNLEGKPQKTAYCNKSCQESHWSAHKAQCLAFRQREKLFRAGQMAQKLFYVYRRELFDKNFISVAHKGRDMILYEDVHGYGQDLTPAKALEKSLVPFPDNLFTETQDREAVLAFRACSDAILLLHEPLSIILKGICASIQRHTVEIKNQERNLTLMWSNGDRDSQPFPHVLLQVKLKSGETYAVDIAGAQYGDYEPVVSWKHYLTNRVNMFVLVKSFVKPERDSTVYMFGGLEALGWMNIISSDKVTECLNMNIPMADLLKLSNTEFQVAVDHILENVADCLQNLKKDLRERGTTAFFQTHLVDQVKEGNEILKPGEWNQIRARLAEIPNFSYDNVPKSVAFLEKAFRPVSRG